MNGLIRDKETQSVISVTECSEHPYKMVKKSQADFRLDFSNWRVENLPRQSLPKILIYKGAFYAAKINDFLRAKTFVTERPELYEMPRERSVNVDDELGLMLADAIFRT